MRWLERFGRVVAFLGFAWLASHFALRFGSGGLWKGLGAAHAVTGDQKWAPYDLTRLTAVNETLKKIKSKYVDPERVNPQQMFINALNQVQREVAPIIVLHDENSPSIRVKVDTEEKEFRVDNVQGPWDVSARLREVFEFLQQHLKDTDVKLQEIEYAACNGMLQTLDPHSVFLSPEAYADMNMSTSGHFGGLGIVIAIRDQMLTVMRPMPGTPAANAGLKRLDRITKINNESTLNMPLDDAVERLRGKPGSEVTVWIAREGKGGWTGSRPFKLIRENIRIESVRSEALGGGIGYVRLEQFQASTSDELEQALNKLRKGSEGLKGLVLDLRGNPGGLLDQAAQVADKFLRRGVIVSTVGHSEGREEKRASAAGTEPNYPMVVLIDGSSASASEIVSGALKNHERAVLVGQTTFGKGSVQLVFSQVAGDAALKLTIAQYLTPGDISIQGVGVTPDIELDPMTADPLEMDLYRSEERLRERDLSKSLTSSGQRNSDRPWTTLRYNLPESERAEMRELGLVRDEFYLDFPIRFARDLVSNMPEGLRRTEQLEATREFIAREQADQLKAVAKDLSQMNIDWAAPDKAHSLNPNDLVVTVTTDRDNNTVTAGQPMALKVSVTNKGQVPAYQVRAVTKSDNPQFDERELVFGKIEPGETKTQSAPMGYCRIPGRKFSTTAPLPTNAVRECVIPEDAVTREDVVKVRVSLEGGEPPPDAEIRPRVVSLPQPNFAYTYQVVDNRAGNGDGQISRGEGVSIYLSVQNTGKGPSRETQALLRNVTGDGLLLHAGRFDVSNMQPGETRDVVFTFDVLENLRENVAKVEVSVVDRDLRVAASEKLVMPVVEGGLFVEADSGLARLPAGATVRSQPLGAAPIVGTVAAPSVFKVLGKFGGFLKVSLEEEGRFGFVEAAGVERLAATVGVAQPKLDVVMSHSPPLLEVEPPVLSTRQDKVRIRGTVTDLDQVRDMYVFVGSRKVFYQSNRNGTTKTRLTFDQELPLTPGVNVITVVARENEDVGTSHTLVVRRDGPNGEALPTPKRELFGADWSFSAPAGE
jgi:carboxyl-terminal processing protease